VIPKIRVLLADDHPLIRRGLASAINIETDIDIVGEASDGREAIDLAKRLLPEIVVMDVSMPHMNGITATRILHSVFPEVRVIGLSMCTEEEGKEMLNAGAVKYLSKTAPVSAILEAIRDAATKPNAGLIPCLQTAAV
jgi:DNA-binding NarL/FixJ family response regulator